MRGAKDDLEAFKRELKNLSLLAHLSHPNIVQLYCSYIYQQKQNLIFAYAEGGSLKDFLAGRINNGLAGSQLLLALADLASAIDALHNFISEAFSLKLSGCHHDLAPRNILIDGDTLLLADFGLSTFRDTDDSFATFQDVSGLYIAPECQNVDDGSLSPQKINRASDIWSFGCILSEILTYMVQGPDGVVKFSNQRTVEIVPGIVGKRFYMSAGKPNPNVLLWLVRLRESGEPFQVRLVDLIRVMLSMDLNKRPRSARVLVMLRGISILSLAGSVELAFDGISPSTRQSVDHILAKLRLQSWLFAFNRLLDDAEKGDLSKVEFEFSTIAEALKETDRIVQVDASHQQSLLRYQHTKMINAIPSYYRSIAKEHLTNTILDSNDAQYLGNLSAALSNVGDEDIGVLIAVKHLTNLSDAGRLTEQRGLALDQKNVTLKEDIGIHSLALLEPSSEHVVVEWLRYKESWADKVNGPALLRRLNSMVSLLHAEITAKVPGSLRCMGMFHDESHRAFGIVYSLPQPGARHCTLYQLLSGKGYRPPLEYRFRLAYDICNAIHTFHKIGWLHRNLHSMNILFFPPDDTDKCEWAKEPRILGFAGSRESQLDAFTNGPDDLSGSLRNYQHPQYLTGHERYREEFDWYSVGMIMLEIGFWSTLSGLTSSDRFRSLEGEDFTKEVIASRVPELRIAMGKRYMKATLTCLEGGLERGPSTMVHTREAGHLSFRNLVLDRIHLMD